MSSKAELNPAIQRLRTQLAASMAREDSLLIDLAERGRKLAAAQARLTALTPKPMRTVYRIAAVLILVTVAAVLIGGLWI